MLISHKLGKKNILDLLISTGSFEQMVQQIIAYGSQKESAYTCCVNVHMTVEASKDPEFRDIVNQADLATPDGMPIAKVINSKHKLRQERVAGMDLVPALFKEAEREGLSVYFYGDTDEVLNALRKKVRKDFPNLRIAGYYSPPFRTLTEQETEQIREQIRESDANLLFVALGCPKQEKWMAQQKGKIPVSMLGIGNAFRTYLGYEKRAPMIMQKMALEWLYRLIQNPRRLWKRYFITNTRFLWLLIRNNPSVLPKVENN